ncbi:tyrosine-type recombinase/integrase [Staphylococcus arlettae]
MNENTIVKHRENSEMMLGSNDDLLGQYIAYVDASKATIATYKRTLKQFFSYLSEHDIKAPQREDVLSFREYLKESGRKPTTVQNYIIVVRQFFKWTAQAGIYPDIANRIKGAKLNHAHKKDYLTQSQVKDVLKQIDISSVKGARDYAIIALMVTTGLRTIEVARANMDDIRNVGDSPVLYIHGKGKEEKTDYVKLPLQVFKALMYYRSKLADNYEKLFVSTSNNNKGKALTTFSVSDIAKQAMKRAGYDSPRLTAHSLRHTAGTLNLMNGGTLEETQQLLRHTDINTTMIYLHHLERADNKSEERIANSIF